MKRTAEELKSMIAEYIGDRTDDQVRGHKEIVHRCSTYTHAECHDDKFAPELLRAQRVHEGLPLIQPVLFGKVFVRGYIRCFAYELAITNLAVRRVSWLSRIVRPCLSFSISSGVVPRIVSKDRCSL